jgi:hypothetical protein
LNYFILLFAQASCFVITLKFKHRPLRVLISRHTATMNLRHCNFPCAGHSLRAYNLATSVMTKEMRHVQKVRYNKCCCDLYFLFSLLHFLKEILAMCTNKCYWQVVKWLLHRRSCKLVAADAERMLNPFFIPRDREIK